MEITARNARLLVSHCVGSFVCKTFVLHTKEWRECDDTYRYLSTLLSTEVKESLPDILRVFLPVMLTRIGVS